MCFKIRFHVYHQNLVHRIHNLVVPKSNKIYCILGLQLHKLKAKLKKLHYPNSDFRLDSIKKSEKVPTIVANCKPVATIGFHRMNRAIYYVHR